VQHNAHELAARYAARAQRVEGATRDALAVQAQKVARALRARVAVGAEGETQQSINVRDTGPMEKTIAPGTAHAWFIEHGVKPGGKGLPRFDGGEDGSIVRWLITKVFRGSGRGSAAYEKIVTLLRDRYYGLAAHIRKHGVKAQPFVEPTAREMAAPVALALRQAVMAAMTDGDSGAAA
jgi:hypothetical protein